MANARLGRWAASNWFVLLLPALAGVAWLLSRPMRMGTDPGMEVAFLVDACLTIPLLYWLCYRGSIPGWQMALRLIGLACGNLYLLGLLLPAESQQLLPHVAPLRSVGLAILIAFELWVFVTVVRLVFRSGTTAEQLQSATGAPPLIAKLMLIEARFWEGVWSLFRGKR